MEKYKGQQYDKCTLYDWWIDTKKKGKFEFVIFCYKNVSNV